MKFTFNLGNLEARQERNNWKEKHCDGNHFHYEPAREMKLENVQLGIEFEMDEVIQICKSSDLTFMELVKLIKELGPQAMDYLSRKEEAKAAVNSRIAELEKDLETARSCKNYIKEKYNKLVRETASKDTTFTKVEDDRELY